MRALTGMLAAVLLIGAGTAMDAAARAQDARELVRLPEPMQEHMLAEMRDHLSALSGIIGAVGDGQYDEAARLAEHRLGMSALGTHGAAHMAPFMPKPMQQMGGDMHHAASRLVIVLQDASLDRTAASLRKVARALHAVTAACTRCHAAYRIR